MTNKKSLRIGIQPKNIRDQIGFRANGGVAQISTWFGCGLLTPAPGTWGTLGGMIVGVPILYFGGFHAFLLVFILTCILGFWACREFEKNACEHDSSMIVVDEVIGVWVTLLLIPFSWINVILAFALFRFFDVLKPWPIRYLDKNISGALGVIIDDVIAGIFAAAAIWGANYVGLG